MGLQDGAALLSVLARGKVKPSGRVQHWASTHPCLEESLPSRDGAGIILTPATSTHDRGHMRRRIGKCGPGIARTCHGLGAHPKRARGLDGNNEKHLIRYAIPLFFSVLADPARVG